MEVIYGNPPLRPPIDSKAPSFCSDGASWKEYVDIMQVFGSGCFCWWWLVVGVWELVFGVWCLVFPFLSFSFFFFTIRNSNILLLPPQGLLETRPQSKTNIFTPSKMAGKIMSSGCERDRKEEGRSGGGARGGC